MNRDDDQPDRPGRSTPTAWTLEGEGPHLGTYTPPAPYRVFRLITGGAPAEPRRPDNPDRYDCLTIRLQESPRLRLVKEQSALESSAVPSADTRKF